MLNVAALQVGADSGAAAAAWFTQALGVACWLVQQRPGSRAAVAPSGPLNSEGRPGGEGTHEGRPGSAAAPGAGAEARAASCASASIGMGPASCLHDTRCFLISLPVLSLLD